MDDLLRWVQELESRENLAELPTKTERIGP
jgi:hypothetical protein